MEPIVKYPGGKRREISHFVGFIPSNYNTYIEPFLGGGALFFQQEPERAIINDVSKPLVNFYEQVANSYQSVLSELQQLHDVYEQNSIQYIKQKEENPSLYVENKNEVLYYSLRKMYNGGVPSEYHQATLYFFLNKTAYSGMIRFNSQGQYNVPFGRYKHFSISSLTKQHSTLLQKAQILNGDFEAIFKMSKSDDFMFLDPPYDCTFHSYDNSTADFDEKEHLRLAQAFTNLGCRALMVIGRTPLTIELYKQYVVAEYPLKYSVNIKNRFVGEASHLVVANYKL